MSLRFIFAIIAIGSGICAAVAYNIPGPIFFILLACCLGFGLLATMLGYSTDREVDEDWP